MQISKFNYMFLVFVISFFVLTNLEANAQFGLKKIVDTKTPVPNSVGVFLDPPFNFQPISIGGGEIAFFGLSLEGPGVYASSGNAIIKVADTKTPIPGGGIGLFTNFGPISPFLTDSAGQGEIVFSGQGTQNQRGIYLFLGGVLQKVVDKNTPVPNSRETFDLPLAPISLGGADVAFSNSLFKIPTQGNYIFSGGTIGVIANQNTLIPDGIGTFDSVGRPISLGNGDVVFGGSDSIGQQGIYAFMGGTLSKLVDTNTAIPDGVGNFSDFDVIVPLGNGDIAFVGTDTNGDEGIYRLIGGGVSKVADFNTLIPNSVDTFSDFRSLVSLDNKDVAFRAFGSNGQRGIYTFISGVLTTVVDNNSLVPNGTGQFLQFFDLTSIGGTDVAFNGIANSPNAGVYKHINGVTSLVANMLTPVPNGNLNEKFTSMSGLIHLGVGKEVAFEGVGSAGTTGVYKGLSELEAILEIILALTQAIIDSNFPTIPPGPDPCITCPPFLSLLDNVLKQVERANSAGPPNSRSSINMLNGAIGKMKVFNSRVDRLSDEIDEFTGEEGTALRWISQGENIIEDLKAAIRSMRRL